MKETVEFLARHDYWVLVGAVLGRQACLPIPANLLLVAAGALAHSGRLSLSRIVTLSVVTFLFADFAWYETGRRLGERILHLVCGLSRNPAPCVHKANEVFNRYGVKTLLFSKFVVGFDAVAAPLAGSAKTSAIRFLFFDGLGAMFWTSAYVALGYLFSNQLDLVATHIGRVGTVMALAIAAAIAFYVVRKLVRWHRFVKQFRLARITPDQLKEKLAAGEDILLVDLQGRIGSTKLPLAIPGAVRIDPHKLERYADVQISPSQEVVLYCSCPGESTSARVALALRQKGIEHVRPLAGGLQAWRNRGYPLTFEVGVPATTAVRA
jgi:membrane protein DedA with SNARE-associated domain/rhodanese-related sulfurtransferase